MQIMSRTDEICIRAAANNKPMPILTFIYYNFIALQQQKNSEV